MAIEVEGLSKSFGRSVALRDVTFSLGWGRALALFGHNGAGKTTLLRILTTLAKADKGTARVAGFDCVANAGRARAVIGYVGHSPLLYDELTVQENLEFFARLYRVPDAKARIAEVLEQTGAADWVGTRVRTLSNGMQKRVSIARALLHRPAVLFFDEAETGLDQDGLRLLDSIVRGVAAGGASVVYTTHSIERGLGLADDVVVLARGRVALSAAAGDIAAADVRSAMEPWAGAVR